MLVTGKQFHPNLKFANKALWLNNCVALVGWLESCIIRKYCTWMKLSTSVKNARLLRREIIDDKMFYCIGPWLNFKCGRSKRAKAGSLEPNLTTKSQWCKTFFLCHRCFDKKISSSVFSGMHFHPSLIFVKGQGQKLYDMMKCTCRWKRPSLFFCQGIDDKEKKFGKIDPKAPKKKYFFYPRTSLDSAWFHDC